MPLKSDLLTIVQWEPNKFTFNGHVIGHPITWSRQTTPGNGNDGTGERLDIDGADGSDQDEYYAKLCSPRSVGELTPTKKPRAI